MCGIFITKSENKINSLDHRGIETYFIKHDEIFLVHNRLPIQTLEGDEYSQPFKLKNGKILLYNGEIFNYDRAEYENDVEFIIHNIDLIRAGELLNELDGFWSIVIFDPDKKSSIVITDPLGKKQLYYNDKGEISSEINNLRNAVSSYDPYYKSQVGKWGYSISDRTPYSEIKRFPPNSIQEINHKTGEIKLIKREYFDFFRGVDSNNVFELIDNAVKTRLISKKFPIGLLLSGGLDSSIIAYHIKDYNVSLYTIENSEYDYARIMADYINKPLNILDMAGVEREDYIKIYKDVYETPIDLGSAIPQYILMKSVKEKIILTGDGADELFGGYKRINSYDSQYSDIFEELTYYHLPRLDRASMHFTIELRNPFLSHDLIRFALKLPLSERKNKKILKNTYSGLIPTEIIERDKHPLKSKNIVEDPLAYRYEILRGFYEKS